MSMGRRAKRILIAIPVVMASAFALYIVVGIATYGYLTVSYNGLKHGMTRAEVTARLRGFAESVASPDCYNIRNVGSPKAQGYTVKRYDLLGLRSMDMPITVAYNKNSRAVWIIDTYE